jgi:hypothetical protein
MERGGLYAIITLSCFVHERSEQREVEKRTEPSSD